MNTHPNRTIIITRTISNASRFARERSRWLLSGSFFLCFVFALLFVRVYDIAGKISVELGAPQDSLIIVKVNEFAKRNVPFLKDKDFAGPSEKIGWVSDIHADRFKHRDVPSGLMFPRQYSTLLPKVFDDLRAQGIDTVIATGDNTNSGDDNYARALEHIAQEKHMRVIWVKGNHDNEKVMSLLNTPKNFYFVDYRTTRIIVLDDVEIGSGSDGDGYFGGIDQSQLDWLKEALQTKQQVIVALHIPIFDANNTLGQYHDLAGGDFSNPGNLLPRYTALESILKASGNVKLVLSGHWHVPWHKEYDGIQYFGEAALTRQYYSGAYAVIDLKSDAVKYLFAK